MEVHTFFITLIAILISARILGELAARLGAPSVIGELTAGILLGPSLLGWVDPLPVIRLLAEIGIILLLFEVGLETDVSRLIKTGFKSIIVAAAGIILPFVFGAFAASTIFHLDLITSLFIGGTLTATSIGITVRVLNDLGRQHGSESNIVLGAAVIDDVIGIVLLAFLYKFSSGGGINLISTGKVLLFILLFLLLAPIAVRLMSEVIRRFGRISQIPGLIPTTVVSLVLFFAWLAHRVGAPELLGGFAAGLALSHRFYFPMGITLKSDPDFTHQIEKQMRPLIHLFTPIFFVMVGLSLNFQIIDWSSQFIWTFSGVLFLLAVLGKVLGAFLIQENMPTRLAIGLAMVPRGEVGLIFAELGRSSNIFNSEIYAAMVIVIALTTVLPPFVMKWLYQRYAHSFPPGHG